MRFSPCRISINHKFFKIMDRCVSEVYQIDEEWLILLIIGISIIYLKIHAKYLRIVLVAKRLDC